MKLVPDPPMKLGAAAGSIPPHGDEHHLTFRVNPEAPTAAELWEMYVLNNGIDNAAQGLAAVWRHGCDAGMTAPEPDDAVGEQP